MVKKRLGRGLDALLGQGSDSVRSNIDNDSTSLKKVKIELLLVSISLGKNSIRKNYKN